MINFTPQSKQRQNAWDSSDDPLWLLTISELDQVVALDPNMELESINGDLKAASQVDRDTRFGYSAWGFRESRLLRTAKRVL